MIAEVAVVPDSPVEWADCWVALFLLYCDRDARDQAGAFISRALDVILQFEQTGVYDAEKMEHGNITASDVSVSESVLEEFSRSDGGQ